MTVRHQRVLSIDFLWHSGLTEVPLPEQSEHRSIRIVSNRRQIKLIGLLHITVENSPFLWARLCLFTVESFSRVRRGGRRLSQETEGYEKETRVKVRSEVTINQSRYNQDDKQGHYFLFVNMLTLTEF